MIKTLPLILFVLLGITVFGQENCSNGIDDDGDGLIDCYDPDCNGNPDCSAFFYGKPAVNCSMNPTNPAFNLNTVWQSPMNVSTRSTMMVGDVDADGTPEVVCHQSGVNELYILNGQTGAIEVTINCPAIDDHVDAIAIGDTDDDGFGEIYVVTSDNILRCFEHDGTTKSGYTPPTTGGISESIPGISDFDMDGVPELYKDNRIYNALTGALIASGTGSTGNNPGSNGSPAGMPVAADVLPDNYCSSCAGLELVCGNMVYTVDIAGGTITPVSNSLPGSLNDGFTSIADIDMNGQLDVVVVSSGTIYVWDPRTGLQIGNSFSIPNTSAGGRANIADYDNDGFPEIGAGGLHRYVCVDVDPSTFALSQKWVNTIVDGSQHTTGSVFDFDCDGRAQVAYRDENVLYVWDGQTGNVISSVPCGSATRSEFPTIVDVDGDGQVNIVCACATGNGGSAGKVIAFNSSANQWVGSRTVMNQHSYSVTNINDDLSIPIQQQSQALIPKINGFQAQSPIYDVNWNSTCIPLADINVIIDSVVFCQKPDSVIIGITICNIGSRVTTSPINISVYNDNPAFGGTHLITTPVAIDVMADSCKSTLLAAPFMGSTGTFYVYVNDNGTNPSAAPQTTFIECDSSNNSNFITASMPALPLVITGDTIICKGDSTALTAAGADTYTWSPATGLNTTTGSTVIAKPVVTTTYTITGTDANTGCNDFTLITVTISPKPVAAFSNTNVCNGVAAQFTGNSTSSPGTIDIHVWDFGDGSSPDLTADPEHTYTTAGTYDVTLMVYNNFGCGDTLIQQDTVYHKPVAGFTTNDVCLGAATAFGNTSTVDPSSTFSSYDWNFGNTVTSVIDNPSHTYTVADTYSVSLIVTTNNACKDTTSNTVTVHPVPEAAFSAENACDGSSVQFNSSSSIASNGLIQSSSWNFGDGASANSANTTHLYASANPYDVQLLVVSDFGCADSITHTVTIHPKPTVVFAANITSGCQPLCVLYQSTSSVSNGNISGWLWDFGDNSSSSSQDAPHCYYNHTPATITFSPTLTVTSDNSCVATLSMNDYISVFPQPNAQFTISPTTVNITDPLISINNSSVVATIWNWNFGDVGTSSVEHPPAHSYSDTGSYTITLIASTQDNCADTAYQTLVVEPDFLFYIPNAFTPNGDGINDTFCGKGIFIKDYEMSIFDRWGSLIYKTQSIESPWSGLANNGKEPAQADVYVYSIIVTDFKMIKHNYKGIVTLVK